MSYNPARGIRQVSLKTILSMLLPKRGRSKARDPISVVLLQRQPHFFSASELQAGAERAWGVSFAGGEKSRNWVVQKGFVTFVGASGHVLSLFHQKRPYHELSDQELRAFLADESRRDWWRAHRAYCAFDHMTAGRDLDLAYRVLTKLVAEMIDTNCCGVFIPGKRVFVPSDTALYENLQLISGNRELQISKQ